MSRAGILKIDVKTAVKGILCLCKKLVTTAKYSLEKQRKAVSILN